jgi:hypothetical protein
VQREALLAKECSGCKEAEQIAIFFQRVWNSVIVSIDTIALLCIFCKFAFVRSLKHSATGASQGKTELDKGRQFSSRYNLVHKHKEVTKLA